jgi:hypothetical protein
VVNASPVTRAEDQRLADEPAAQRALGTKAAGEPWDLSLEIRSILRLTYTAAAV